MVASLSKILPTIQSFTDDSYYKCYKASGLSPDASQGIPVYVIALVDFRNYIDSSYQLKTDWTKVNIVSQNIRLTPINVMDSSWQSAYGQPFDVISFANAKDFSFPSDFNCLSPSNLQSGSGIIKSIGSRSITVDNLQGGLNTLNLSTCTRMETTQFLPSIGQTVYWRGNAGAQSGSFNIYRASCI